MSTQKSYLYKVIMIISSILIISCVNEDFDEITDNENTQTPNVKKFFKDNPILVKKLDNGFYLHDDVVLSASQLTDKPIGYTTNPDVKLAFRQGTTIWPNNTIVYYISSRLSSNIRNRVLESMRIYEEKTNIRFKATTNYDDAYVYIKSNSDNCNCGRATYGKVRGGFIELGSNTSIGIILHEIGHTLGFLHEFKRSDRNNHVSINFDNIDGNNAGNFDRYNNSVNLGSFDKKSIMMYYSYAFSRNGRATITGKDGEIFDTPSELSSSDIIGVNTIYPSDDDNDDDDDDDVKTATITVAINRGIDDVEEGENGNLSINSSDLEMAYENNNGYQKVGLHFRDLNIPKNATITKAYLQFTADESNDRTTYLEISLHDSSDSESFDKNDRYDVSERNVFSTKVNWLPRDWDKYDSNRDQRTPELKNMVQRLVQKTNWKSGNDASFIIRATGSSLNRTYRKRVAESYEGGASKAAKLVVDYTYR